MEKTLLKEISDAGLYMCETQKPVVYNSRKNQFETPQGIRISDITKSMKFASLPDDVCKCIATLLVNFSRQYDKIMKHDKSKFSIDPRKITNKENKICPLCDGVKHYIEKYPNMSVFTTSYDNGELMCKNFRFKGDIEELADFVSKTGEYLLAVATRKMNKKEIKEFNKLLNI